MDCSGFFFLIAQINSAIFSLHDNFNFNLYCLTAGISLLFKIGEDDVVIRPYFMFYCYVFLALNQILADDYCPHAARPSGHSSVCLSVRYF